jgi:hypothetical protein
MAFFITAAGPYGIEPAVQGAGPLVVIITSFAMPLLLAVPTGLYTAELSSMFDENGGLVLWVGARGVCGSPLGFRRGTHCAAPRRRRRLRERLAQLVAGRTLGME